MDGNIVLRSFARARLVLFISTFLTVFISGQAWAIPASPHPFLELQGDGSQVTLRVRGDEHFNWLEDDQGYTVVRHNGWLHYAERNAKGQLQAGPFRVGTDNPAALGLQKGLLPSKALQAQSALQKFSNADMLASSIEPPQLVSTIGTLKNLVVMMRYADHTSRPLPPVGDYDTLMNATGGDPVIAPTGSLKDLYHEISYDQLTINSTLSGWIDVSNNEIYYGSDNNGASITGQEAMREALDALDASIDFSDYDEDGDGFVDSIAFLHSGYGAEWGGHPTRIWSHKWVFVAQSGPNLVASPWVSEEGIQVFDYHISTGVWSAPEYGGFVDGEIGRVGVIAHETGHFLGLPDLYDTDGSGNGIGSWGLMASSWGFDGQQYCPSHMTPWSKAQLGWISPTVISADGEYTADQAETNISAYRINEGFPANEYLMLENRQPVGIDCTMPQGGLLIWHIDDVAGYNIEGYPGQSGWPGNGNHYRVALLQADGDYDLEKNINGGDAGDVHHGAGVDAIGPGPGGDPNTDAYQNGLVFPTDITISNISNSAASMTFCLNDCSALEAPTGLVATPQGTTDIALDWTDNASTETGYRVDHSTDGANWSLEANLAADANSYNDSGLTPGSTHYYRVRAFDASSSSGWSNTANATLADVVPAVATNLSATGVSQSQIDVSWDDNADNEVTYRLERSAGGVIWQTLVTLPADTTSYSHTGLSAGQTVFYRVLANNGAGSSISDSTSGTTLPADPEVDFLAYVDQYGSGEVFGTFVNTHADDGVVQSFREKVSGGKKRDRSTFMGHYWRFNISAGDTLSLHTNAWQGPTSDNDHFTFAYSTDDLDYTDLFTVSSTDQDNVQSAEIPNSVSGVVWIRVIDTDRTPGNSSSLDELFVDHLFIRVVNDGPPTAPDAPSALSAVSGGETSIDLSWTDNANNENGFRVERSPDGSNGWTEVANLGSNTQSWTNNGLLDNTTYFYRVLAWNGVGDSNWSNTTSATTDLDPPPPADPTNLSATATGKTTIALSWDDNANNENGYQIHRSTDGSNFSQIASVAGSSFNDSGLSAGTQYWYKVRAFNVADLSGFSNTATATTDVGNPPAAPGSLGAAANGTDAIDINWLDNASNEDDYRVERADGGQGNWIEIVTLGAGANSYADSGLNDNTTYDYRVRAHNADGFSGYSNVASATTDEDLGPPITLSTSGFKSRGKINFDLSWSGATSGQVDIYRDGSYVTTTGNDGSHSYNSGLKGGGSFTHQVCEAGTGVCSNTTVTNL